MKYPKFLNENSVIGITAPSCGVLSHLEDYEKSIENLEKNHWKIIETENVRTSGDVSSSKEERAKEFLELWSNEEVDAIICATGGDFLTDMLPYLEDIPSNHEKWVMGASDPTNLLYLLATKYDIATIYGHNAGSFDAKKLHPAQITALEYLKGNILPQESYALYEKERDNRVDRNYFLTEKVEWKSTIEDFQITGRLIGGCIDCLRYLVGTKYDYTKDFITRYKEDGIIWYFDIFSMSAEDFYLTLFQLKEAGWFQSTKGVVIGRVLYPSSNTEMTYQKAVEEMLPDIPVILDADIGHVAPKMTLINGSAATITYQNKKGKIEQFLK